MRALGRTTAALAVTAACVAAVGTGSAAASTLTLTSGTATYTGGAHDANHLSISYDLWHGVYVIEDTGVPSITVSGTGNSPCRSTGAQTATCNWGSVTAFVARLGNAGSFAESKLSFTPVTFYAGAGNDTLIGGGSPTTLVAGAGTDTLTGGTGATHFVGSTGSTTMTAGTGHNSYQGGSGADTINARNGVTEDVSCGGGVDSVTADPADTAAADCETVDRGVAPSTGGGTDPGTGAGTGTTATLEPPLPSIATAPVSVVANRVPIGVSCPAAATDGCTGTLVLSLPVAGAANGKVVAARRVKREISRPKRFRLKAGAKTVVRVVLSRRGARQFRQATRGRKSLKVVLNVAMQSGMATQKTTRTITVRAERRSRGNQKARRKK